MAYERELIEAIKNLQEEMNSLAAEIEELKQVNQKINEKLHLTNEYLSTIN